MTSPSLTRYDAPGHPRGMILMLHGGKESSHTPVDRGSLSWRRSLAMQRTIGPRARKEGVSTWLLRYRHRGWNDLAAPSPVPDGRWALDEVRRELGPVPVVLLGHSMGARVAVRAADDDQVTGVVALAPWFPPGDPVDALTGKHLVAAHGRGDRITSYQATALYVARARSVAASATLHDMGPVGHYMLRNLRAWNDFAISQSLAVLEPF